MKPIQGRPHASATALDGAALLARTAALGEYFELPVAGEDDWQSIRTLFEPAVMSDFVARTRVAIAESARCDPGVITIKTAASAFQLGVVARLLSPVVGAATCFGAVPLLDPRSVRWQSTPGHTPRFAITSVDWVKTPTPSNAAAAISTSVLAAIFTPLNEHLRTLTALSPQVSWGNVISAANGAVTVLAMSQPRQEPRGRTLVRELADTDQLAETATFADGTFLRRSCCLFYQVPGSGLCTVCVLTE
jgi:hypothetical protein